MQPRVTLICENPACRQEFKVTPCEAANRKYCSRACSSSAGNGSSNRPMTEVQFQVIAELLKVTGPVLLAAHAVLVKKLPCADAVKAFGCTVTSVHKTESKFRDADKIIRKAYAYRRGTK